MSGYDERLLASAPAATRAEKQVCFSYPLIASVSIGALVDGEQAGWGFAEDAGAGRAGR